MTSREIGVVPLPIRRATYSGPWPGGLANQDIVGALHLGYGTVKTHVSSLLLKLGCRDRAQLVMYAYETGLAVPGATS